MFQLRKNNSNCFQSIVYIIGKNMIRDKIKKKSWLKSIWTCIKCNNIVQTYSTALASLLMKTTYMIPHSTAPSRNWLKLLCLALSSILDNWVGLEWYCLGKSPLSVWLVVTVQFTLWLYSCACLSEIGQIEERVKHQSPFGIGNWISFPDDTLIHLYLWDKLCQKS